MSAYLTALSAGPAFADQATLSVNNTSVVEGNSGTTPLDFDVVRGGDMTSNIVVPFTVTPGTATPGVDYTPPRNKLLRIPAGQIHGVVSVPVIGDTTPEPNETLFFKLGAPAAYDPDAKFLTAPSYGVGSTPNSVARADFNGDGKPDLAVANVGSNNVSILLGDGSGGFGAATNFDVGPTPVFLAIGDFNGDGKPDLAVVNANFPTSTVSVLLGDGSGGFGAATAFAAGASSSSVALADFNGDGKLDIAVDGYTNSVGSVLILLGTGDGRFSAATSYGVGGGGRPVFLAIGDFNGDGKPDVAAVNNNSNNVSILLGNGTGGFGAATNFGVGNSPVSVAIGDFNGDGKPDLAVANEFSNTVSLLLGNGSGGFGSATNFGVGSFPTSVAVGDFNGDGKPDLAVANVSSNNVSVLLGNGGGFRAITDIAVGNTPSSVAVADFNGDSKPDLAVANQGDSNVSILLSNGDGSSSFGKAKNFDALDRPSSIAVADFNRDGRRDLVVTNPYRNAISILLGDGQGGFGPAKSLSLSLSFGAPVFAAIGDFNGDGKLDLAVANFGNSNVSILLGDGSGGFGAATNFAVGSAPNSIAVGDFNGDGKPDLAVANVTSNNVSVLLGNGDGSFGAATNFAVGAQPYSVAVGDFNGDGKLDLATANGSNNNVSVLLGDGNGGFGAPTLLGVGLTPQSIASGDFNGDGKPDLVVANNLGKNVSILLNAPDSTAVLSNSTATGTIFNDDSTNPNAFSFTPVASAALNSVYTSNTITVSGLSSGVTVPISVAGGSYSIGCTSSFVTTAGSIGNGQKVCVRQTSSAAFFTATTTTLTIDRLSAGYVVTTLAADTVPNGFVLGSVTGVNPSSTQTSNVVTVSGINAPSPISISGASGQYKINGGSFTSASGTVNNGDTVTVQAIASTAYGATNAATLSIGGVTANFSISTRAANTTPTPFSFSPVTGATPGATVSSNSILVTGIEAPAPISISGDTSAKFCINGGTCVATVGAVVNNGDTVTVQLTASTSLNASVQATLNIGGFTAGFMVTTASTLPVVTSSFAISTSGAATVNTPVSDGPAGTYSFNAQFCANNGQLSQLYSQTNRLTNNDSLHNRTGDGPTPGQPGGVGSTLSFARTGAYADGVLSPKECLTVPYVIGLANKNKFTFTIDVHGVKN